jgi:hypothetical protein
LRSRPEPAPINSGPATTFFFSTSNARFVDKLSPPPKVRTERILQNSRLNPDETSSPVDQECRIPAKWAFFTAGDERIPKTEDSLAEQSEFELSGDF